MSIYKIDEKIPSTTSKTYKTLLTTKDFEAIAKEHGYNLHSLLNIIYGQTKITENNIEMVNKVHEASLVKIADLKSNLKRESIRSEITS